MNALQFLRDSGVPRKTALKMAASLQKELDEQEEKKKKEEERKARLAKQAIKKSDNKLVSEATVKDVTEPRNTYTSKEE